MPSILEHPQAQELLHAANISPRQVNACAGRLHRFLHRYWPLFKRQEQRDNALIILEGKLSGLDRKTSEPIAHQAGVHRKPVQAFVGSGAWDDEAILAEVRHHVGEQWHDPGGVLTVDTSGFPKKGDQSCGVTRQWCGRLGKVDNCQLGVFVGYACQHGHTLLDRQLFLPLEWANDPQRRQKTHVPAKVVYQETWRIALNVLQRCQEVPHAWVTADDEFGRVQDFRAELRQREERYLVDVPADTLIRDLEAEPPQQQRRCGSLPKMPFETVSHWAMRQPKNRWQQIEVRAGEKGVVQVEAMTVRVQTQYRRRRSGPEERLVVRRDLQAEGKGKLSYHLSNAVSGVSLEELVRAKGKHQQIEQMLQEGKGEVGLDHYEVRSWVGWHHHMTLSLLALLFLALERGRVGGEKTLLTVSQLREVFTRLLRRRRTTAAKIADEINRVLRRTEEARIYAWIAKHNRYPPPRKDAA
jgi:SRSO17 transposase